MASGALDFSREPLRDSITTESLSKVIVVQILMAQQKGEVLTTKYTKLIKS